MIDAMTIDVESFGNDQNANKSHFFRVRDIGASGRIPFIIKGNGNVGVGTDTPESRLTVFENGLAGSSQLQLKTAHNRNTERYFMKNTIYGQGSEDITFSLRHDGQMYVDGNVGIGVASPQYKLDVAGKSSFSDNMIVKAKLEAKRSKSNPDANSRFCF